MRNPTCPFMWAPSTTVSTPLARAARQISRTGISTPVGLRMPEKLSTRVRGPIEEITMSASCSRLCGGCGIFTSRTVIPCRCARSAHGAMPLGCSWSVISTSSPAFRSIPLAITLIASVAQCVKASSSFLQPTKAAISARSASSSS